MDKIRARRMAAELRGVSIGGWVVGDYLGNGASAVVLSAQRGRQTGALKLIDPEIEERYGRDRQLARVERELEVVGHTHPHLVKIFDGGRCSDTGHLYLVMELLAHPQLTALIPEFPRERVGPVIRQIASAARFLEERRLVHRDIKPDNIAITRDCEHAVLLDLGVVRPLNEPELADADTGDAFLGTTRYSPPEYLIRQEEEDLLAWRAITFYQLGAVLHDMIMRRRLFDEISAPPARLIEAVRSSRPVIDASDVSPHLIALARNCLHKDWRLRTELVRWDDFDETAPTVGGEAATERIRRRLAVRTEGTAAPPQVAHAAVSRRRMMEDLGGSVANLVRDICLQAGTFPPLEVQHEGAGQERHVLVKTGPSEPHSLEYRLEVCLSVALLDEEALIVRVRGASATGALPPNVAPEAWITIYTGEMSAPMLRERLDAFLHLALDAAAGSSAGEILRLVWLE